MAHPFPKKRFTRIQGKAASAKINWPSTRTALLCLTAAVFIPNALAFGDYVARKTVATIQMAPHCQTIGPCHWIPKEQIQIAKN